MNALVFNPAGTMLASSSNDGTVRLWVFRGKDDKYDDKIPSMACTCNGSWHDSEPSFGSGSHRPEITAENADQVVAIRQLGYGSVADITFSPDDQYLAVGTGTGVALYDVHDFSDEPRFFEGGGGITFPSGVFSRENLLNAGAISPDRVLNPYQFADSTLGNTMVQCVQAERNTKYNWNQDAPNHNAPNALPSTQNTQCFDLIQVNVDSNTSNDKFDPTAITDMNQCKHAPADAFN